MKYILITKNPETMEVVNEQVFKSINQIVKELDATYCSCYNNYLLNIGEVKEPKKRSQVLFNRRYTIKDV